MNGSQTIYNDLLANVLLLSLLDTYNSVPMITDKNIIPKKWSIKKSTVNFYLTTPINNSLEFGQYSYTINCRASDELKSQQIANSVTALNRFNNRDYEYYITTQVTLAPSSVDDNYNTPVEVLIKSQKALD